MRRKGSVLDASLAEVRQLEKKMGAADKGRMEQYLTSVREAEIRTRRADAWIDTPLPAIEQFSYFLTRLAETKDLGGKPLLGTTMALFGSGMCYDHSHGNANLPPPSQREKAEAARPPRKG